MEGIRCHGLKVSRVRPFFAWPTAELAVMGPQGAVEILHRRELQSAADPEAKNRISR